MICSFNSSATGCEYTSSLLQGENNSSHVVTTGPLNQIFSYFIRQSSRAETTSSHVVTVTTSLRLLNQRSVSDFITPSSQAETTTNQDPTTSKPVTRRIHHQKTISDSLLITIVIGALIALPGICVVTHFFLNYCDSENSKKRTPVVPEGMLTIVSL